MNIEYELADFVDQNNSNFAIVIKDSVSRSVEEISYENDVIDTLPPLLEKNHDEVAIQIPSSAFQLESSSEEEHQSLKEREFENVYIETENSTRAEYNHMYVLSNSPMASNCNSDLEDRQSIDFPQNFVRRKSKNASYKKITYEDVEKSLSKYYDEDERAFTEMDVIMTYLKGIRLLYTQSKTTTQMKLYCLIMFAIGSSMSLAILAPFVKDTHWGFYLLSSGNAFITILIAITRYLKLDHNMVGFSFMAKQYAKFENKLDFENGFLQNVNIEKNDESPNFSQPDTFEENDMNPDYKKQAAMLQDIEMQLTEMREICNVLVPEDIIRLLPLIYNTNLFRFVKKMRQYKTNLIIRFRDIKNEIYYILHKWKTEEDPVKPPVKFVSPRRERGRKRLLYLMELKEKTKADLLLCRSTYTQIDELFNKEIRYAETHQSCLGCAGWFRPDYDFSKLNPVVRDYLKLVVPD